MIRKPILNQGRLPHVCETLSRHSGIGNIFLLLITLYVIWRIIWPSAFDIIMNEPAITTQLTIEYNNSEGVVVKDYTTSKHYVAGSRINRTYDEKGLIICNEHWPRSWNGNHNNIWGFTAFTDCKSIPDKKISVCSEFSLRSVSGIERTFGSRAFCSPWVNPMDLVRANEPT